MTSSNSWVKITLSCSDEQSKILEDILFELGVQSITLLDSDDLPILEPGVGETPLWKTLQLCALFDVGVDASKILNILSEKTDFDLPPARVEILEDKDWQKEWEKQYRPIFFGKNLWVCPSWIEPPEPEACNLLLDPGLAFGTGTHPTTALCLEWLDAHPLQDKTVIDYGCGSGILAIAALLLGAQKTIAVDNDPQALTATFENAKRNNCETGIKIYQVDEFFQQHADKKVDIVLANILALPLIELAENLSLLVKESGMIVLSGILTEQAESVIESYSAQFTFEKVCERGEWVRLQGKKLSVA